MRNERQQLAFDISVIEDKLNRFGNHMSERYKKALQQEAWEKRERLYWLIAESRGSWMYHYGGFWEPDEEELISANDTKEWLEDMIDEAKEGKYDNWDNERENCIQEEDTLGQEED